MSPGLCWGEMEIIMKKIVKKIVSISILSILVFGCIGCSSKETAKTETDNSVVETQQEAEKEDDSSSKNNDETAKEENTTDKATDEKTVVEDTDTNEVEEAEKEEFVSDRSYVFDTLSKIKVGWNLGNSLDSRGTGNTVEAETFWGNPKTTQAMIDEIANKGFNAIRIPVTWAEHVSSGPEYTIDSAWLDRVQEVVDYAVANDLYILLDTHHEENDWLITDPENSEALNAELASIWKQVGERFKDYNEKLIFEGMNEPRKVGSSKEWNGGTPEERALINEMNKTFVDTVRATGGNNENRILVICPYGNSPANKALSELEIPEDNNIAVAIHMYTPYIFTYVPTNSLEVWDGSKKAEIVNTIKQLDQYLIQKDVPVVITEFGAQYKNNSEEIIKWLDDYMSSMNKYGIKCFWWDNGCLDSGNELFGIFDRNNVKWYRPEIADKLIEMGNME